MHFTKITGAALLASCAAAAPIVKRQSGITDADILQFALTLEHLENVFYKEGLQKFTEQDFIDAGFTAQYYNNLKYVAHDEETHVTSLEAALKSAGVTPVAAATYNFGITDPKTFVTIASILEGVGDSAYLGAAPLIQSKEYLTVAGSILSVENLHTSVQRLAIGQVAAANPFQTPIGANEAYTLAAAFITAMPASNAAAMLPFKAFPTLTAVQGMPAAPGINVLFSTKENVPVGSYVTFVNGLITESQPAIVRDGMITATIPHNASGLTYAILTNAATTSVMDSQVIAGPALIEVTPDAPTYDITIQ